jgi:oligoribonuclease (3'-5' exoribonuclease)
VADSRTTCLIIDLATSGFREALDTILEVAVILVDVGTLDVIDTYSATVRQPDGTKVPDFHKGLLAECVDPERSNSMGAVEGFLLAGQWTTADIICNRNLDFDLRFLAKHVPTFAAALRKKPAIELKALDQLYTALGGKPWKSDAPRTFRAGDDAIAALEELGRYASGLAREAHLLDAHSSTPETFIDRDGYHS